MSLVEGNWQTTRPTIRERSAFLFNNDLLSDVKFVVRGSNGESESKKVIPAHKFVLSISSPVFLAMFHGVLAETTDSIDLPDCEYEGLLELFRYMYSDEVNLTGNNVMQMLYLAKKYMVPSLADKCAEYLAENLDASNTLCVLPHAQLYEEKDLVSRCWQEIDRQAEQAVKSDGFLAIERSLLEALVYRDTLHVKEVELFRAVDAWATQECERQGMVAEGEAKRRILGEGVVKGIRFPVMSLNEFASIVLDCDILTKQEAFDMVKYFSSALITSSLGFTARQRVGYCGSLLQRCSRFDSVGNPIWRYDSGSRYCITVSVDKDILLYGLCMFGSANNQYSLNLDLKDIASNSVLMSKAGSFQSVPMKHKLIANEYHGFDVLFDAPVPLKKSAKYCFEADISGPVSCYGQNGLSFVKGSGVTFHFQSCDPINVHGIHIERGLFHELLFILQ